MISSLEDLAHKVPVTRTHNSLSLSPGWHLVRHATQVRVQGHPLTVVGFGCSRDLRTADQSSLWEFRERLLSIRWVTDTEDLDVYPKRINSDAEEGSPMKRSELLPDRWQTSHNGLHKANGLAIHSDRRKSEIAAIREIVERAALFRLWYSTEAFALELNDRFSLANGLSVTSYEGMIGESDHFAVSVLQGDDLFIIGSAVRGDSLSAREHSQAEVLMIAEGTLSSMTSPYSKAASTEKLHGLRGPLGLARQRHFAQIASRCAGADAQSCLPYEKSDIILFPLVSWPGVHLTRALVDRGPLSSPVESLPADLPLDPFV